jgi:tetratricopeptide (TPR) repeat protein
MVGIYGDDLPGPRAAQQEEGAGATSQPVRESDSFTARPSAAPFMCPPAPEFFVGRGQELGKLSVLLVPGAIVSIYSLADIGGLGKTTLALRIAHRLRERFPGGVFWACVSRQATADILQSFAAACGQPDLSGYPDLPARVAALRGMLAVRRALIILDDAQSDEQVAPFVVEGECTLLVTTRRHDLPSLLGRAKGIELARFSPQEALQLFEQACRAKRSVRDREAIEGLCQWLGYLPLALSIATAQLASRPGLSVISLLQQLQASERRLAALEISTDHGARVAFEASYNALPPQEQALLDALGVFAGPDFAVRAASAAAQVGEVQAQKSLDRLRELSLVQVGRRPGRYALHPLVRGYTLSHLRERGDEEPSLRVARHYLTIMREAMGGPESLSQGAGLAMVDEEIDNIRASHAWAVERAEPEALVLIRDYIVSGMASYFRQRGSWSDWIEWGQQGLEACSLLRDVDGWVAIASGLGLAYTTRQEWGQASEIYQKALSAFDKLGDTYGMAQALGNLGNIYARQQAWDEARASYQQALQAFESLDDAANMARTLGNLGSIYAARGEWGQASASYLRALQLFVKLEDRQEAAQTYVNLAGAYAATEDWERASEAYERAFEAYERTANGLGMAQTLSNLGNVYARLKKWTEAGEAYQKALGIMEALGDVQSMGLTYMNLGNIYVRQAEWSRAIEAYHKSLAIAEEVGYTYGVAQAYNNLGLIQRSQGQREEARLFLGKALELFRQLDVTEDAKQVQSWLSEL